MNAARTVKDVINTIPVRIIFLYPYMLQIKIMIAKKPINHANNAPVNALTHRLGLIFSSCIKIKGAGNVPSFNALDNCLADSVVNDQLISAVPPQILVWIFGAVSRFPPTNIAIGFPTFA